MAYTTLMRQGQEVNVAVRITKAEEPTAVELRWLAKGGVTVVCDTDEDWREFITKVVTRYHNWMNTNTDIFDPVTVEATMDLNADKPHKGLRIEGQDLIEHAKAFSELDPLEPHEFDHSFVTLTEGLTPSEQETNPVVSAYIDALANEENRDEPGWAPLTAKELATKWNISMYEAYLALQEASSEYTNELAFPHHPVKWGNDNDG